MTPFLKSLSLAGMALMAFPLLVLAEVACAGGLGAALTVKLLFAGIGAVFVGFALDLPVRFIKNPVLNRVYSVLSRGIAVLFGLVSLFVRSQMALTVVTAVFLSYCCFLGVNNRRKAFSEVYSAIMLEFFALLSVAVFLYCNAKSPEAGGAIVIVLIDEFVIAGVLHNQANIEKQINRRLDIRALVPADLRKFNLSLILLAGATFTVLYLFRDWIKTAVIFAVKTVVVALISLYSILPVKSSAPQTETNAAGFMPPQESSDIVAQIINWLLTILIAAIVFKFRRTIWNAVKSFFMRIIEFFKPKKVVVKQTAAYKDFYENIKYEKNERRRDNSLADCVKLYKKENSPAKKIRLSYKIFLLRLIKSGGIVNLSDTAEEQARLAGSDYCSAYCEVRYGDGDGKSGVALADEVVHSQFFHTSGQ